MSTNHNAVRAIEMPSCPFCNGAVYYKNWITHRLFQMECENCKSHWRTGINQDEKRDMYVELIKTEQNEELTKYLHMKKPMDYWQKLIEPLD